MKLYMLAYPPPLPPPPPMRYTRIINQLSSHIYGSPPDRDPLPRPILEPHRAEGGIWNRGLNEPSTHTTLQNILALERFRYLFPPLPRARKPFSPSHCAGPLCYFTRMVFVPGIVCPMYAPCMPCVCPVCLLYAPLLPSAMRKATDLGDPHIAFWRPLIWQLDCVLDKLPNHQGTVYRGVGLHFDEDKYRQGNAVCWPAFSSASTQEGVAKEFVEKKKKEEGTLFFVHSTRAKAVSQFSRFPEEQEVLFRPNTGFEVSETLYKRNQIASFHDVTHDCIEMREASGDPQQAPCARGTLGAVTYPGLPGLPHTRVPMTPVYTGPDNCSSGPSGPNSTVTQRKIGLPQLVTSSADLIEPSAQDMLASPPESKAHTPSSSGMPILYT